MLAVLQADLGACHGDWMACPGLVVLVLVAQRGAESVQASAPRWRDGQQRWLM